MSKDILYDCAKAYSKLENYQFEFTLYYGKNIKNFSLNFTPSEFKHLTALEKLEDKPMFSQITSSQLYNKILNNEITYDTISDSSYLHMPVNDVSRNGTSYCVIDRINALSNLYDYLHGMANDNTRIYKWLKDAHSSARPNHSDIKADFLLEFKSKYDDTRADETTCVFLVETNSQNGTVAMSIFPTDISYSDDGSISVERCQILSVNEIDKERNTCVNLISAPEELREKAYSDSLSKAQSITIKQDIKALKSKRKDFSLKNDTKSQTAYQRRLDIFKNKNIYTVDMLNEVLKSLTSQLESRNNKDVGHLIEQEIKTIRNEIIRRETEKNAELPSSITIAKSIRNDNGTISMTKPLVTIETPQAVIKAKSQIEKGTHLADSSIRNIFTDIKDSFKKVISKLNKKTPERKPSKGSSVKSKSRAAQTVKPKTSVQMPIKEQKLEEEKVPMFSIAELQSDKYAPTSSKDKDSGRTKKNDLDL